MRPSIIVIDGANCVQRSVNAWAAPIGMAIKDLRKAGASDAEITQRIMPQLSGWLSVYMFARSLHALINENMPVWRVVFANEGGTQRRREFFPGYKQKRRERRQAAICGSPSEFDATLHADSAYAEQTPEHHFELAKERHADACYKYVEHFMPFVCMCYPDHEADDVCAAVAQAAHPYANVMIASGDSDVRQLQALPNVTVYDLGRKEVLKPLDPNDVRDADLARWKAIVGDQSDEIPGVTGETTAAKILAEGRLEDELDKKMCRREGNKGLTWRQAYERNIRLVSLLGERRLFPLIDEQTIWRAIEAPPSFSETDLIEIAKLMKFNKWFDEDGTPGRQLRDQCGTWSRLVAASCVPSPFPSAVVASSDRPQLDGAGGAAAE